MKRSEVLVSIGIVSIFLVLAWFGVHRLRDKARAANLGKPVPEVVEDSLPSWEEVRVITVEGHKYVAMYSRMDGGCSIVHAASCPCLEES